MTEQDIEKWDNIMFSILENELDSQSTSAYIKAISKDKFLAERWDQWQNTKFQTEEVLEDTFIESLKKEEVRKGLLWIPMGIAASIALIAMFVLNFSLDENEGVTVDNSPKDKVEKETILEQEYSHLESAIKPIAVLNKAPSHTAPTRPKIESNKTDFSPVSDNYIQNNLLIDLDTLPELITDDIKTITQVEKSIEPNTQDSVVVQQLKEIIAQKQRARGDDIVVHIEDNSRALASNVDRAIKKTLGNYEIAGKRTRYSIIKEVCEENLYCYTLVIENNQNKTYLKL